MSKTESGDKKYYRVLNILNRLNEGPVRISDLCSEFNISERSIQRDIERINLTGFQLDTPSKGVYMFAPGVSLKNFNLTGEQLSVLVLMREMAAGMGGAIKEAFDKVFARATKSTAADSLFYAIGAKALNPLTRGFYEDIVFAIENRKKISMLYSSASGARERLVCPVKILTSESFFYLMAMPDAPANGAKFIKYRVDRIKDLKILPEEFTPPSPELIKRTIGSATTIWGVNEGKTEKIALRAVGAAADFMLNKEILPRQKVSKPGPDGAVTVSAVIHHRMEVVPLVLHWMPEITVTAPEALKADIKNRIHEYLRKQVG
ncbi:MAG TPA: WYL domain-containing protein [Elusimicrobiales bacterium]|nr:WYL domain-containing protein [Elusimicrobiales bacterium]